MAAFNQMGSTRDQPRGPAPSGTIEAELPAENPSRRVLFVVNDPRYFVTHRLNLAKGVRAAGYEVHIAAPTGLYPEVESAIRDAGFPLHHVGIERQGTNVLRDAMVVLSLVRLYRRLRPQVVHHITVKPILYGSLAARIARVPATINAVSGLGRLFFAESVMDRIRIRLLRTLYKTVLRRKNTLSIFQNQDDRQKFLRAGITTQDSSVLIEGSGTDLHTFRPNAQPEDPPIVLLPARVLQQKGVGEFVAAARALRMEGANARFVIVGDSAGNRDAFPAEALDAARSQGWIETWGWLDDIPGVMAKAAIVCLPTYHEGLPKALIDACAAARPIVATNIPGCRAVVTDGLNGILVPAKDATALAAALKTLLGDPVLRRQMGEAALSIAKARFDVAEVIRATIAVYERANYMALSSA